MATPADGEVSSSGPRAFACFVDAQPEHVWTALTDANHTRAYLYGLAAHSTWDLDAPIEFRSPGQRSLDGRVVCLRTGSRLSYQLHAGPDDPPTYLTWLIRPSAGGAMVRLYVDEVDQSDDDRAEAEDVWLPVLAALQRHLASEHGGA